jgi:hypothetical protein
MRPFYDARLRDLGPDDLVIVECLCGYSTTLTAAMLATAGVKELDWIKGLPRRLRCQACKKAGRAGGKPSVSIVWAAKTSG